VWKSRVLLTAETPGSFQDGRAVGRPSGLLSIPGQPRLSWKYTDKKENKIFLIYKEIQNGAVVKSYMTNGFLIYGEIFAHFLIY
jgi:hypothetical protein